MLSKLMRHMRANVVAYIALFFALSGTAYAAAKWTGADIVDESLTGADIRNGSLSAGDLSVAAAFGSNNAGNPLPHIDTVQSSATVNVARTSTLLIFGQSDSLSICFTPEAGENVCQIVLGLYLDGSPVPESQGPAAGRFPGEFLAFEGTPMFGMVQHVAPGTHTVAVAVGSNAGDDLLTGFAGDRVAAIVIPE